MTKKNTSYVSVLLKSNIFIIKQISSCIISNFKVNDEIPHYRIEDALNLRTVREIQHVIDVEETYIKMEETLKTDT